MRDAHSAVEDYMREKQCVGLHRHVRVVILVVNAGGIVTKSDGMWVV